MSNINLLPWRNALLLAQQRKTRLLCAALLLSTLLLISICRSYGTYRLHHQQKRNLYLQTSLNSLANATKQISGLQKLNNTVLLRTELIQQLQKSRLQNAYAFKQLAFKLPTGIYYDEISKTNNVIKLKGKAQSNALVSELMHVLETSILFENVSLNIVTVVQHGGISVSDFELALNQVLK